MAKSKIKVAYIVSTLKKSGPTNQLLNIVSNLDLNVFQPIVITLSPEPAESLLKEFKRAEVTLYTLDLSRWSGVVFGLKKLRKLISTAKPDLLHTQGIRSDILASYLDKPHICTIRNYLQLDYPMTYGKLVGSVMTKCHIAFLKRIDVIAACSKSVSRNLLLSGVNSNAVQNGVNTKLYYPLSSAGKEQLRLHLGLPVDKQIFISTGHLTRRKDPLTVLRAFEALSSESTVLLFLGDGDMRAELEKQCSKDSRIIFTGRVINVDEYLKSSDFFVSASRAEGLPNAAIEAMACGLPLIISDIAPHEELFELNQNIGQIFRERDSSSLAEAMEKAMNFDREAAKSNCLTVINEHLSAKVMSQTYQELYVDVVRKIR
ncbi:glycosyltransferase [Endozoicomonas gorgoniicola]|uniref:Glycosyltransferase n=1 Tax=Endozoicomonas gorgoniicola TaxID=1234144 RepID=A0ABT3MUZ8_9GAMM|nr:glycosyltransferase [Endozoicomonas gorgoniicola]MCW7553209.1 glycosyltransferase [Endozoicomonas gorgoniicola]